MDLEKPTGREIRVAADTWPGADLELRAEGDGMTFRGYAAVFNSPSEPMPFVETIEPGAFTRTLKRDRNIRMFRNHNIDALLGTTNAKTLSLSEDSKGLLAEARLNPDTSAGRDTAADIARGDVTSMSFGFLPIREKWTDRAGNDVEPWMGENRRLLEVRLFEVSPVTGWPAYPATTAFVRQLAESIGEEMEPLEVAFRVLSAPEGKLSEEQHDLLMRAIAVRTDRPYVGPNLADWRARLAEKGLAV